MHRGAEPPQPLPSSLESCRLGAPAAEGSLVVQEVLLSLHKPMIWKAHLCGL